jgi:hypothetical protein
MQRAGRRLSYPARLPLANRCVSSSPARNLELPAVSCIISSIDKLPVDQFRHEAFVPQQPRLITTSTDPSVNTAAHCSIPAATKWFIVKPEGGQSLNIPYLERFKDVLLPCELVSHRAERSGLLADSAIEDEIFQRFYAPLDLFLTASQSSPTPRLYIAQAQLLDLPQALRDDLPTPPVVLKAGKGDIYGANIWMGIPPTYTPLHKDPNPNLFLQLASNKLVRLFMPDIGAAIFRGVQERIRSHASAAFRGDEMMQGAERVALEDAVWNCPEGIDGFEVVVRPGDALFIPKGWWHSIKSIGTNVTASVCLISVLRKMQWTDITR